MAGAIGGGNKVGGGKGGGGGKGLGGILGAVGSLFGPIGTLVGSIAGKVLDSAMSKKMGDATSNLPQQALSDGANAAIQERSQTA